MSETNYPAPVGSIAYMASDAYVMPVHVYDYVKWSPKHAKKVRGVVLEFGDNACILEIPACADSEFHEPGKATIIAIPAQCIFPSLDAVRAVGITVPLLDIISRMG